MEEHSGQKKNVCDHWAVFDAQLSAVKFVVRVFVAFVGIFIINTKRIACQMKCVFQFWRSNIGKSALMHSNDFFVAVVFSLLLFTVCIASIIFIFMMWLWWKISYFDKFSLLKSDNATSKWRNVIAAWPQFHSQKSQMCWFWYLI